MREGRAEEVAPVARSGPKQQSETGAREWPWDMRGRSRITGERIPGPLL